MNRPRRATLPAALLAACLAPLALGGCDLAPAYHPPEVAVPRSFKEAFVATSATPQQPQRLPPPWQVAEPGDAAPRGKWWTVYGDAGLDRLEDSLDTANQSLAGAVAAYDSARAFTQEAEAGLSPTVALGAALSRNRQSAHRPLRSRQQPTYYGANTINAQASYELDIWGRVRDAVAASHADEQASAAELAALRLSLEAELASDYVALRGLDEDIALLRHTARAYERALEMVQARYAGSIASGVDVAQAQAQLDDARAQITTAEANRQLLEHAIATLTGAPASVFALPDQPTLLRLPAIPAGLPSTLLQRRPDIAAAERQAAAANALIGAARAAFYPAISFNLGGGFQDTGLNLVSLPESVWSLGPSISLPLLEGGLRRAELAGAEASFRQAAARYKATVLRAFQDVEDQLALLRWLGQSADEEEAAQRAAQREADLALTLYRDGAEAYLQVVSAQTAALGAARTAIDLRTRRLQASISLIRALGGGWDGR